jgi:hypothetical protein
MITPVFLLDELKTFLEQVVENYRLETNQPDKIKPPISIFFD